MQIWGEVLSWSCKGLSVPYRAVLDALEAAGLDAKAAGEMRPRHAFSRACRKLAKERVIRVIHETADVAQFQFTREYARGGRLDYELEAILTLSKATGKVAGEATELAAQAQAEMDRAIACRTGGDVTRITQRLFKKQADLFPIRDAGGVYFVPEKHAGFVSRVQKFLGGVGGVLQRMPVATGTPDGDRCVKETVLRGIEDLIGQHHAAIEELGDDARAATFERAAQKIHGTRLKLEGYAEYLGEWRGRLTGELERARERLRRKVEEVERRREEEAEVAVPA
jgi:hypothetical protein